MSKVVSLNGDVVPAAGEPNEFLIESLEKALEEAKSGQLQSMIGRGFCTDGAVYTIWVDDHPNFYEMRGALAWLESEYVHRVTEEENATEE